MNEACHTHKWVMSHIWMRHVTHTNEACHTYEWGMSHLRTHHATPHSYVTINEVSFNMPHLYVTMNEVSFDIPHSSVTMNEVSFESSVTNACHIRHATYICHERMPHTSVTFRMILVKSLLCDIWMRHSYECQMTLLCVVCHTHSYSNMSHTLICHTYKSHLTLPYGQTLHPYWEWVCFGWYVLALSVRKRIFLKANKIDQKHCENWWRDSGSEFHKAFPMCERGEWRKQLRDFITQSLKKSPLGSGTILSLFWPKGMNALCICRMTLVCMEYEWGMSHVHLRLVTNLKICVTWLIHMCDMTHSSA